MAHPGSVAQVAAVEVPVIGADRSGVAGRSGAAAVGSPAAEAVVGMRVAAIGTPAVIGRPAA